VVVVIHADATAAVAAATAAEGLQGSLPVASQPGHSHIKLLNLLLTINNQQLTNDLQ